MLPVHKGNDAMFSIACRVNACVLDRMRENRNIGFEIEEMPQGAFGVSKLHRHRDTWKFPFERSENFGGVKGADCGEAQVPGVQRAVRSQQLISLVPELIDAW